MEKHSMHGMSVHAMVCTDDEWFILKESRRLIEAGDTSGYNLFSNYYFRKPTTGTQWYPGGRCVGHYRGVLSYALLLEAWEISGYRKQLTVTVDDVPMQIDVGGTTEPVFRYNHGYLFLDWIMPVIDLNTRASYVEAGSGCGKTSGVCISNLIKCALFPGYGFLNAGPTERQAQMMQKEATRWIVGSQFMKFVDLIGLRDGSLFRERNTVMYIRSPFDPQYRSTFMVLTTGYDASNIIGESLDEIHVDECQLIYGIGAMVPTWLSRLRGLRDDATPRIPQLMFSTNPGQNPELAEVEDTVKRMGEKGLKVEIIKNVHTSVNPYVTEDQLSIQEAGMSAAARARWLEGSGEQYRLYSSIPVNLIDQCRDTTLDAEIENRPSENKVVVSDLLGLLHYEFARKADHIYIVCGDPGQNDLGSISNNNVPVVVVVDMGTNETFLEEPFVLHSLHMINGDGSFRPYLSQFRDCMGIYGKGYYDATNLSTAWEDDGSLDMFDTTPLNFGSNNKAWAKTILITLLTNKMFRWPHIKILRHQANVYRESGRGVDKLPDDLLAALMVFCMALRADGAWWSRMATRYSELRESHVMPDSRLLGKIKKSAARNIRGRGRSRR